MKMPMPMAKIMTLVEMAAKVEAMKVERCRLNPVEACVECDRFGA